MPPFKQKPFEGWIHSDRLQRIPPQKLMTEQADAFLEWLFSAIARRPRPLSLREGAEVARYLKGLAWEAKEGPLRQHLDWLAEIIWGTVFTYAPFQPAGKKSVVRFLTTHDATYLAGLDVKVALQHVQESPEPALASALSAPPRVMGRNISVSGAGTPQLRDDLSERIYVAYHALRRAGIHGARGRIASALNQRGVTTRARPATGNEWGPSEVSERVKQYEARLRSLKDRRSMALQAGRGKVVDKWLYLFHSRQG